MRRYIFAAIVMAIAVLATALPAYAASAVLTVGSTSGPAVANGDSLTANLLNGSTNPATFKNTGNSNQVSCTSSTFSATAGSSNPPPPGTATESLTGQSFGGCTTNFGPTVNSVKLDNLPYNVAVTDPGTNNVTVSPGSSGVIHATVTVTQVFQFKCQYVVHDPSGDLFGTTNNTNNSLTFTNQQFDLQQGSVACFQRANFSAQYGPVQDTTQGSGNVFTN